MLVTWSKRGRAQLDRLDNVIPYGIAPGNHDADVMWTDNYTTWSRYYPASKFAGKTWFGAAIGLRKHGQRMDVRKSLTASGTPVQQYHDNATAAQRWNPIFKANGTFKFQTILNTAKCLDVTGASSNSGALMQLYDDNNSDAQSWILYRY